MSKFSYKSLFIIFFFLLIGVVVLSRFILPHKTVSASWWNESWSYRKAISVNNTGGNQSNVYITLTIDTSDSTRFQNNCGDIRFTDQSNNLLDYYIVSGCGTSSTSIHTNFPSLINGYSTFYLYYGNSLAQDGFSSSDFSTAATNSTPTTNSEELSPAPIAYWKFDEGVGTTAYDSTSNQNNGVLSIGTSTPVWTSEDQCISGTCLYFNGTSSCKVTIPNSPSIQTIDSQTISMWIKPTAFSTRRNPINKAYGGEETMTLETGGYIKYYWGTAGANSTPYQGFSSSVISLNNWNYITIVRDLVNNKLTWYLNGKQTTQTTPSYTQATASTSDLIIGTGYAGSFIGYLDEVKIYPYARTADQIKQDYNSRGSSKGSSVNLGVKSSTAPSLKSSLVGHWKFDENNGSTVYDSSGNNKNGTLSSWTSSPSWNNDGYSNKSLSFDGNDSITLANEIVSTSSIRTNGVTYSAWIKLNNISGTQKIFGQKPSSGYSDLASGGIDISSGKARMIAYDDGVAYKYATGNTILNSDQWYLITGVYDPSDQKIKIYVNGKFDGGETTITTFNRLISNDYNLIGSHNYTSSFFNGLIDEVKIYNRNLTDDEIRQEYNSGSAIQFGSTNQTIGGTTTSLEYCIPGDTSHCAPPVAEWNFEENNGTIAKDISGNSNNGTINGATWTVGKKNTGAGLNFNGTNNYVSIPTYNYTTNATISVWVKGNYANGNQIIIGSPNSIALGLYNIGSTKALIGSASVSKSVGIANNFINDEWNYLSVVFDNSGNATYYCNGQLLSNSGTNHWSWNSEAYIGKRDSGTYFKGSIDQIKIYNYARTPAQIAYDYNKGAPIAHWKLDECQGLTAFDSSGSGYTGVISIGPSGNQTSVGTCQIGTSAAWTAGASGKINSSLNFDGIDDYINIGSPENLLNIKNAITFSAWINPNEDTSQDSIISGGTSVLNGIWLRQTLPTILYLTIEVDNTRRDSVGWTPIFNKWSHIIGIGDANNGKTHLYINGKLIGSTSFTPGLLTNIQRFYIGNGYGFFKGQIDDVHIYNYALTSDQVKTVYNNGAINFN